jgi:hypothetical protein
MRGAQIAVAEAEHRITQLGKEQTSCFGPWPMACFKSKRYEVVR